MLNVVCACALENLKTDECPRFLKPILKEIVCRLSGVNGQLLSNNPTMCLCVKMCISRIRIRTSIFNNLDGPFVPKICATL